MVHRAPDSRLLTNLINHEKEYAKHLAALFPLSHAALASLSAYAAASPAQSIATLVDILASADDALQRYTLAIDAWREQLVALKDLEDDLAAVLRDRDILVTRLIKASKSTRDAHRSSRLVAPLTGLASASLSSLPSTNSTIAGSTGPASTNARLAQAQAELQACEAHLVTKERELDARRISIARDGLGARCRALIDCGWVWGEMGKQGLKALQALNVNGSSLAAPKPSSAIPPRLSTNPITYASDNSSLTPSQSASQTAARSVETSHEGPTSKEHDEITSKPPARTTRPKDDEDLTLTLPPAHAIPELAFPTGVRAQPLQNGDPTAKPPPAADTSAYTTPAPAPRRKRTKRGRRPPSQHIIEVSDEGSDADRNANVNASPLVQHTPFPTARATPGRHDSSSEDEHPVGPLQVVDNDPFEVIRRSMLDPSVLVAPSARASTPDVRVRGTGATSPSKAGVGQSPGSSPAKRQRRTSMAFFGSLRGLFRKPKERERLGADWDDGHSSPSPASPNRPRTKMGGGWVTRTDARIKSRGGEEDSDEEPTPTNGANVGRRGTSGMRLRKGRPGASMRENGSSHRDGWITDSPTGAGSGVGAGGAGTGTGRSGTRRGTVKRKKTSVADLRGNDQGHTDGEVDGGGRRALERGSTKGNGNTPEASVSTPKPDVKVEVEQEEERDLARRGAAPTDTHPTADPNANVTPGTQHRRATTTTATSSRKPSTNAAPAHRRSASLSFVEVHVTSGSESTHATSTGGSMSKRKPPPQIEPPTQSQAQAQAPRTHESQPKQNARRLLGNGHATHVHKQAQSQSLMSIVADVTRLNQDQNHGEDRDRDRDRVDKAKSLDMPRAPGSVFREVGRDRDREVDGRERGVNGRGHARTMSEDGGQGQGQGQRAIKMPLRSALRNASRTPSPSPAFVTVPAVVPVEEVGKEGVEEERGGGVISPSLRDSASISSYETGRESFDVEEREGASSPIQAQSSPPRSQSQPTASRSQSSVLGSQVDTLSPPSLSFTFPPPPVDPPPVRGGTTASKPIPNADANAIQPHPSSSTVSTETTLPVRRKSVRMSLQPTFSSTPPALCDENGEGYAPWDGTFSEGGRRARGGGHADVWADSSEEDEVYSRARRLLNLVGHDKGKARSKK